MGAIADLVLTGIWKLAKIGIDAARASAEEAEAVKAHLTAAIADLDAAQGALPEKLKANDDAADKALADKFPSD